LLLSEPENVVRAPAKVGVVNLFGLGAVATGGDLVLEDGHLLLKLSGVSPGLDHALLEGADVVVNRRSVIAA
jgi:hypothetical protein